MRSDTLILLLLDHSGGKINGKTLIQKRAYFISKLLQYDLDYRPHYYGPYSNEIENGLAKLKSLGFIQEQILGFGISDNVGFEVRRYDYKLTKDGTQIVQYLKESNPGECEKILGCLNKLRAAGDNSDYVTLSVAAKTFHIISKADKNSELTPEGITATASQFGWNISSVELDKGVKLLSKLYS